MYLDLKNKNIDSILDDRNCSIGKKLSDNELIGIPFQIIIGKRDLKNGFVEIKDRLKNSSLKIAKDQVLENLLPKIKL